MPLHGEITLDARDAYGELRAMRTALSTFAKETKDALNLTATVNLDKNALKEVKTALASISKEELQNAKEMARVREIDSRTRLNEVKALAIEERRQLAQTRREEQVAARERRAEQKEAREALNAQKKLGAEMAREIEAGYRRGGVTINRFGEEVKTVTGYLRTMESEMRKARQARSELFDRASMGATIAGGAILGGAGVSVNSYVEMDRSLRNVNTIAQLTEGSLQELGDQVLRLSEDPNIRKGPQDLTDSLYTIYSSGKEGAEALSILNDAALGASGGLTTTDTSAKVLLATLNSGIPGVNNSREAMNVLFKTVDRGVLTFEQLSGTLGAVLPTAEKAGIPLQELGAYLAVATKNGQSASDATNDLLNLITKLANPSKEARDAFDKLGIEYGFSALQAKGLGGVLDDIQRKTGGNADAIKKLLPDMQAQRGALTALKNAGSDYRAELVQMNRANEGTGALMKAVAQQNKGAAYETDMLRKDFEKLRIESGQALAPALRDVVKDARDVIKWFNSLDQATKENYIRWAAAGGAALLLLRPLRDILQIVKALRDMHYAAGAAAGAQATAEELAAGRTLRAWTGTRARLVALFRHPITIGVTLGVAGYEGLRRSGALGEDAPGTGEAAGNALRRLMNLTAKSNRPLWDLQGNANDIVDSWYRHNEGGSFSLSEADTIRHNLATGSLYYRQERARAAREALRQGPPNVPAGAGTGAGTSAARPASTAASNPLAGWDSGDDGTPRKSAAEREREKAQRKAELVARQEAAQALRIEKALLENVAKGYDAKATAVENAARREIAALRDVQSELRQTFAGIQEKFLDLGDTSNPLGGVLKQLDSLFNFGGRAQGVVAHHGDVAQGHRDAARDARNAKNSAKGVAGGSKTGLIPVAGPGTLRPADWRQFATVVPGSKSSGPGGNFRDWLRGFEGGSLNSQVTLPEAWGPMISRKAEGAEVRRLIQELLGGDKGASVIRDTVKNLNSANAPQVLKNLEQWGGEPLALSGTDYDKALQFWRYIANNADELLNAKKVLEETKGTVKDAVAEAAKGAASALRSAPGQATTLMEEASAAYAEIGREEAKGAAEEWRRIEEVNAGMIQDTLDAIEAYQAQAKEYSDHTVQVAIDIANEQKAVADEIFAGMNQSLFEMGNITWGAPDFSLPEESPFDGRPALELPNVKEISAAEQAYRDLFAGISAGAVQMEGGLKGAFSSILDNLKNMAQQMAANWIFEQLMGLAFGGGAKSGVPTFTVPFVPNHSFDPKNPFPGHAMGLDRVPYDNYVARLHRDEMIVPAQQANQMRQFMNARSVPPSQGFGGGTVSVTYVHNGNIITSDPLDYQQQVRRMGNRMSSHEQERRMAEMARRGGGGF